MPKKPPTDAATTIPAHGALGQEVAVELVRRILVSHGGDLRVTIRCTRCGESVECSLGAPDGRLISHAIASPCAHSN